jgi:hypothetical protein
MLRSTGAMPDGEVRGGTQSASVRSQAIKGAQIETAAGRDVVEQREAGASDRLRVA